MDTRTSSILSYGSCYDQGRTRVHNPPTLSLYIPEEGYQYTDGPRPSNKGVKEIGGSGTWKRGFVLLPEDWFRTISCDFPVRNPKLVRYHSDIGVQNSGCRP